jgi:hypothetical protein
MGNSIQDYLKKINSRLSVFDAVSVVVTAVFLVILSVYLSWLFMLRQKPVTYTKGAAEERGSVGDSRPFGSRYGITYTYSWCQGNDRIKPENKVFFATIEEAESSGRTLSKLCAK